MGEVALPLFHEKLVVLREIRTKQGIEALNHRRQLDFFVLHLSGPGTRDPLHLAGLSLDELDIALPHLLKAVRS